MSGDTNEQGREREGSWTQILKELGDGEKQDDKLVIYHVNIVLTFQTVAHNLLQATLWGKAHFKNARCETCELSFIWGKMRS